MELCKWYEIVIKFDMDEDACEITGDGTLCGGDTKRCECEQLRQAELKAEAVDLRADADRESGKL